MRIARPYAYIVPAALFFMCAICLAETTVDIDVTQVMAQKMQMERTLEDHVNNVLEKMIGPGKATVVINIEPEVEKSRQEIETWAEQKKEEAAPSTPPVSRQPREYLPGIPLKKSLVEDVTETKQGEPAAKQTGSKRSIESIVKLPPSFIKRMRVIMTIDERIKDEMVSTVESLVGEILDLNPARGDRLIVKRLRYTGPSILSRIFLNPYFYVIFLILMVAGMFVFFIFGPIKRFMFGLLETLREVAATKKETEAVAAAGPGGEAAGLEEGEQQPSEEEKLSAMMEGEIQEQIQKEGEPIMSILFGEGEERKQLNPFNFIKGADLKKVLFLMKKESPKTIALVLSLLDPAQGAQLLSSLSPEERVSVTLEAAKLKHISRDELVKIAEAIRQKIDFVTGGIDKIAEMVAMMDEPSRKDFMATLEENNPALADKIKSLIFTFDQIVNMDDQTLRFILEEVDTESLAVALRNVSEKLKKKLMSNMSEGAAALLKETMEFGKPATLAQIQAEQRKIIELVHRLEREGKISLGGAKHGYALEEEELSDQELAGLMEGVQAMDNAQTSAAPAPVEADNEKAVDMYNKGIEAYEAGDYQRAVDNFSQSIVYNPGIWQAHQYLGSCYYAMGKEAEGLRAYKKALELNPENQDLKAWVEQNAS